VQQTLKEARVRMFPRAVALEIPPPGPRYDNVSSNLKPVIAGVRIAAPEQPEVAGSVSTKSGQ